MDNSLRQKGFIQIPILITIVVRAYRDTGGLEYGSVQR